MWIKDADGSDLSTLDLTFSVDEEVCSFHGNECHFISVLLYFYVVCNLIREEKFVSLGKLSAVISWLFLSFCCFFVFISDNNNNKVSYEVRRQCR